MAQIVKKSIFDSRSNVIDYTADQRLALEKILQWGESTDKFFLLSGYAGTGKTTIAENIAEYYRADVMAPTNAAVKRLKDKIKCNTTGFSTLHSALYGGPDPKTGEFVKSKGLIYKRTYIVDECSMIDQQVLLDLISAANSSKSKIIFMGDNFQLEPVGKDPQIFAWEKTHMDFKEQWKHTLYEVKRNDGAILKAATHLRTVCEPALLYQDDSSFNIVRKFSQSLLNDITNDKNYIVLTSTNNKRLEYNRLIRGVRYKEEASNSVMDFEKVISIANTMYSNGEQYVIRDPVILETFSREVDMGKPNQPDYKFYKFVFIEHKIETDNEKEKEKLFRTLLITDLDKPSLHPAVLLKLNSFKFDNRFTVDVEYGKKRVKAWNPNVIISTYGYATSTHKAQGQEWDNVYINADWLSDAWDKARWLYTAITRAKCQVEIKQAYTYRVVKDGK